LRKFLQEIVVKRQGHANGDDADKARHEAGVDTVAQDFTELSKSGNGPDYEVTLAGIEQARLFDNFDQVVTTLGRDIPGAHRPWPGSALRTYT
jgi:hypothetical protein